MVKSQQLISHVESLNSDQTFHGTFQAPTRSVSKAWLTGVVLVNFGINVAFFAPLQALLALQATAIDPSNKEGILALVTGYGALVSLFANPIFGAFSDRCTSRFGRRVPWIIIGGLSGSIGLFTLSLAPSVTLLVLGWCLTQLGCNGTLAALAAVIPDQVPVVERGKASGLAAMGNVVGVLGGSVVGMIFAGALMQGYWVAAGVFLLTCVIFPFVANDQKITKADLNPFSLREFLQGFWVSPKKYPDFAWAWVTRFLVLQGTSIITLYLLFYLSDQVKYPNPSQGVMILTGLFAVLTLITAVIGGVLSDRVGKRKPFVIAAAGIIAFSSLIMAFVPTWSGAVIASIILGIGNGAYLAVDMALITQVLPTQLSRGKDLGVINVAASLPQVIAPLIGLLFIKGLGALNISWLQGSYSALYVAAGLIGLCGAGFVLKIKSVQ